VTLPSLTVRSFSKVNLALEILGRRPDGYHEIRTVLQAIDIHDVLNFLPSRELEFECREIEGLAPEGNLVWMAATRLARHVGGRRGAHIQLRKTIPVGAGLGGGSGNAAATLLGLCRFWALDIPSDELVSIGAELGSDVPFFLQGGTALGAGKGDEISPLPDIATRHLVIVFPGVSISTSEAYRSLNLKLTSLQEPHKIHSFCGELVQRLSCPDEIFNDFETSILPAYPAVREALDFLKERGATASLLSGSGSSVFGFFHDEESALAVSRAFRRESWRVFPAKTLSRVEYFLRMFG